MLTDPQTFTWVLGINGATATGGGTTSSNFVAISRTDTSSTYRYTIDSTHWIDLFVGHQYGKRNRFTMRFTEVELVPDPTNTELNIQKSTSYSVVADRSLLGAATNEIKLLTALGMSVITLTDGTMKFGRVLIGET